MGRRHFRESIDISDKASQATPSPVEIPEKIATEVTPTAVEPEVSEAHEVPLEDLGEEVPAPPPKPKRKRKSRAKPKAKAKG